MDSEDKSSSESATSQIKYVTIRSRVLTGGLQSQNKGAIDWGWQSLVAYGCQTLVVVIDPKNVQVLQTLNKHKTAVVKVKWAKENYYHDLANPYYPKLASADVAGNIIVWDVVYAKPLSNFSDGNNKSVLEMEWLSYWSAFHEFLAVLHSPYSFIIWNTTNGNKLWKKSYTESLLSFSFDPFDPCNVAFLAQDSILFIDDFTLSKVPSSNGRKFYISNAASMSGSTTNLMNAGSSSSTSTNEDKASTRERLRRRVRFLVNDDSKNTGKPDDGYHSKECLCLTYHKACRHHLLLLYPKEILIVDLEINQTIGIINLERNGSPYVQVYTCQQRDVLYCLHENGSVSFRVRRRTNNYPVSVSPNDGTAAAMMGGDGSGDMFLEVGYDLRCQSDSLRLTKHARLMGMTCCPLSENKVALLLSDGRLLFLDLVAMEKAANGLSSIPYKGVTHAQGDHPKTSLDDLISTTSDDFHSSKDVSGPTLTFRFLLTGLLSGLAAPPLVIRMCPPLTTKNWNMYQPLLAAGTTQGTIQIVCMASGMVQKELSIHSCPIRGIEWVSLHGFLSYAYPNVNSATGLVRNELVLTDIVSGKTTVLRTDKEESPIEMIRVSSLKQYFIVVFKDEPFELWDLRRVTLLRKMPKKFPTINALEWSPAGNFMKKLKTTEKDMLKSSSSTSINTPVTPTEPSIDFHEKVLVKEQFVFADTSGQLYNFSVEGNSIKDGTKLPADSMMGSITCIAWRWEQVVMGDVDGNLTLWDLKARLSKTVSTHRGWIKKVRFAPGRGNMKVLVLYNDGVDIWDLREVEVVSLLKCPRDFPKIQDVDWAASDTPVLAAVDGCLYLMDLKLKHSTSPTYRYQLQDPVFFPHLSTSEAALNLRAFLQNQSWRKSYSLEFTEEDGIRGDDLAALNNYIASVDSNVRSFLPHCPFGSAERCLLTASLFGDESELHFWKIALYYLRAEKQKLTVTAEDTSDQDSHNAKNDLRQLSQKPNVPLDSCYDVICDSQTFQKRQLDRVSLHDSKRGTYEQTKKCAEMLILLGQTDRAVQLLLETESENENYYVDCLRACLVASVRSSGAAQSTIKLVATNLIASGRTSEGVQLLCLIDKPTDACRYLQSYGHWDRAAWLAKSTLNSTECQEVMKRWVDHLCSPQINQKDKAVLVLLSMGQFQKALEMLYVAKYAERAAMFLHACQEHGFLTKDESNSLLLEVVLLEYARYLFALGNTPAAFHYCNLVGPQGQQLRKEMEILSEDATS